MRRVPAVLAMVLLLPLLCRGEFSWRDIGNGQVELRENGAPVLVYNYSPQLKEGAPENKRRCCYIFPAYTPAGVSPLDDFPKDHWHHRGLFWSWPIVATGGKQYDIWELSTARHRTIKSPKTAGGKRQARLKTESVWQAGGKDIVREKLSLTVQPAQERSREMDVELTWEAIEDPVVLQGSPSRGKSYGGFSARFAPREGTVIRADGEVLAKGEDLNPRKWAELEATYGGRRAVLRITPDAKNPGAPHQWCLRPYGFVGASFPGRTEKVDRYTLERNRPLTLKFRVRLADVR